MNIAVSGYGVTSWNLDFPPSGIKYIRSAFPSRTPFVSIPKNSSFDLLQTYNAIPLDYSQPYIIDSESTNFIWWAFEKNWVNQGHSDAMQESTLRKIISCLESDFCRKIISKSKYGMELGIKNGLRTKRITSKLDYVYPAVEKVEIRDAAPSDTTKILFVGMDFHRKGGYPLLKAFEELQKKHKNIQLDLVTYLTRGPDRDCGKYTGTEEERKFSLSIINQNTNITLHEGVQRERLFNQFYPNADILAFPSMGETFGYVPLEAMAHGLPVITTEVAAQPEIVEHGRSGFIIKALAYHNENHRENNYPHFTKERESYNPYLANHLIEYLSTLIEDPQLRATMGKRGLEIARTKFSLEARNDKLKRIYNEALN